MRNRALAVAVFLCGCNKHTPVHSTPAATTLTLSSIAFDFGSVTIGTTATQAFTLTNSGAAPASLSANPPATPFAFAGGAFPGTGGTCGASLATNAACSFVVAFSPTVAGPAAASLAVSGLSLTLTGTGTTTNPGTTDAHLVLANSIGSLNGDTTFDFGPSAGGAAHMFYLSNTGGAEATLEVSVSAPDFTISDAIYPNLNACGPSLAAGDICTLTVSFDPQSAGAKSAMLQANEASLSLSATGVSGAYLIVADWPCWPDGCFPPNAPFDFSQDTNLSFYFFDVINVGDATASNISAAFVGADAAKFHIFLQACTSLEPGDICNVYGSIVGYDPPPSVTAATLSVSYDGGSAPGQTATRDVAFALTSNAQLLIADLSCDEDCVSYGYSDFGDEPGWELWVINDGLTDATNVSAAALGNGFAYAGGSYPGTNGTCSDVIASGGRCFVTLSFTPSTAGGIRTTPLTLTYTDAPGSAASVTQILAAHTPHAGALFVTRNDCSPSDPFCPIVNYGTFGVPVAITFTVENVGLVDVTNIAVSLGTTHFFFAGGYPGAGGTCGTTLASGERCTWVVTFLGSGVSGIERDALSFTYDDGAGVHRSSTRQLEGHLSLEALISLRTTFEDSFALSFLDFPPSNVTTEHAVYVSNQGGSAATTLAATFQTGVQFSLAGGACPGGGGDCGSSLASGAFCRLVIAFTPTTGTTVLDELTVTHDAGNASLSLTGPGAGGAVVAVGDSVCDFLADCATGTEIDFGTVAIGGSANHVVTLTNVGTATETHLAPSFVNAAPAFSFTGGSYPGGGTCGSSLVVGDHCTIGFAFSPTTTPTVDSDVELLAIAGVGSYVELSGSGTSQALLQVSACPSCGSGYNYGASSAPITHTFTVSNIGAVSSGAITAEALLAPFSFSGGFPGSGGDCSGAPLAAGASCTFVVTYSPDDTGQAVGSVALDYDDGSGNSVKAYANLSAESFSTALLTVTGNRDFGSIASGAHGDAIFTLTNAGGAVATGIADAGALFGAYVYPGTFPGGGTCTSTLPAGSSCTVIVRFSPPTPGVFLDEWVVTYDGGTLIENLIGDAT